MAGRGFEKHTALDSHGAVWKKKKNYGALCQQNTKIYIEVLRKRKVYFDNFEKKKRNFVINDFVQYCYVSTHFQNLHVYQTCFRLCFPNIILSFTSHWTVERLLNKVIAIVYFIFLPPHFAKKLEPLYILTVFKHNHLRPVILCSIGSNLSLI